jgi:solute carrier family 13 (sodium-dependent dicarboxylate transporter), member 2/3/5
MDHRCRRGLAGRPDGVALLQALKLEHAPRVARLIRSRGLLLGLGPAAFAGVLALPLPGLEPAAHRLAAIMVWAVLYWVTGAIPLAATAVGASVVAVALGVGTARTVAASYADPVILVFVGSFVIAAGLQESGLDRRFAWGLLRQRWATRTPARLLAAMGVITCGLSLWLSNTATTALMLPVGQGLLRSVEPALGPAAGRFGTGLMLMLTWGSSVAVGIPVGSPPNLIAIGMLRDLEGRRLTFLDWVGVAMPLTVVMLGLCWAILAWRYCPRSENLGATSSGDDPGRTGLGPWRPAERNVVLVFVLVCALWAWPAMASYEWAVALGGAGLLLVVPVSVRRREATLGWRRAIRIDWGTILLFGGGLALGRLMFETGLAETIGRTLVRLSGAESLWALTAVAIVSAVLLSEAASNTASASVLVPVMIAVAQGMGVSPIPPALGAALGASFGFMLPVSTPPNAIVFGSGLVPLPEMIRAGIFLDLAGIAVIWLGLRLLCPVLGLV